MNLGYLLILLMEVRRIRLSKIYLSRSLIKHRLLFPFGNLLLCYHIILLSFQLLSFRVELVPDDLLSNFLLFVSLFLDLISLSAYFMA